MVAYEINLIFDIINFYVTINHIKKRGKNMPNNNMDLIELLIQKRKQLNLTQNQLSQQINVSHTSVARIESGEMNPTLKLFISMANELGYDVTLKKIDETKESLDGITRSRKK